MAEVDTGAGAAYFRALHAVGAVLVKGDRTLDRLEETRPAAAAFELGLAAKQWCAGDRVDEGAGARLVEMRAAEGAFGALFEGDALLLGAEQLEAQPFPEMLMVPLLAGVARDLTAVLEQYDGRRGEQRLFQLPALGRARHHGGSDRDIRLPLIQDLGAKLLAERAGLGLEHDQLAFGGQLINRQRLRPVATRPGSIGGVIHPPCRQARSSHPDSSPGSSGGSPRPGCSAPAARPPW